MIMTVEIEGAGGDGEIEMGKVGGRGGGCGREEVLVIMTVGIEGAGVEEGGEMTERRGECGREER